MAANLMMLWFALQSGTAVTSGPAWTLTYDGRSTNDIILDHRMRSLIDTRVPAKLSAELVQALGGPPGPVVVKDQRYVTMSACVAHACPAKGFFWMDTRTGIGLGAVALTWTHLGADSLRLGSNGMSAWHLQPDAKAALLTWLSEQSINPDVVEFVDVRGATSKIKLTP
jgi:hypothetical protein